MVQNMIVWHTLSEAYAVRIPISENMGPVLTENLEEKPQKCSKGSDQEYHNG